MMVINLPERKDRLESMRRQFGKFTVVEGIRHPMPHTGCGLAHIDAIQKGLASKEWCLVLEDDCTLLVSLEEFEKLVEELACEDFDVCVLNPNHDTLGELKMGLGEIKIKKSGKLFQTNPTNRLVSTHAYIAKRSILPKLEEFERVLLRNDIFLPIDRLFFADHWDPKELTTFERCLLQKKPPYIKWTTPRTKIFIETMVVVVSDTFVSDHTGEKFPDIKIDTQKLYAFLQSLPSTESEREDLPLNIII